MNKQTLFTGCLSALLLSATPNLKAEWQDWAIGGAVAAGVGGIVYWATRPDAPDIVKQKAEKYFLEVSAADTALVNTYVQSANRVSEDLILLVTEKGRTYCTTRWFVSDDSYISYDCARSAPLVRGYAALLEESENLLAYREKLIAAFGSAQAARYEYYNFDNLEGCAHLLKNIAHAIEKQNSFMIARDAFSMHRKQMRELERLQLQIATMHNTHTNNYYFHPAR